MLPQVQHVLKYFSIPGFIEELSPLDVEQVVLVCLSSSEFGDLEWKLRVLSDAEKIMEASRANPLLSGKLRHRRRVLSRLYPTQVESYPQFDIIALSDGSSNLGEVKLFHVQLLIDRDELSRAWHELKKFTPLDPPSTEDRRVMQKITLFRQRICHFAGDFPAALRFSAELQQAGDMFKEVVPSFFTEVMAVRCELGDFDEAMSMLPSLFREVGQAINMQAPGSNFVPQSWKDLKAIGRRYSLAAAGAYFTKGLRTLVNGHGLDAAQPSLCTSREIYESLEQEYMGYSNPGTAASIRHFSVLAGLAMIVHLECQFGVTNKWEIALRSWESASEVATLRLGPNFRNEIEPLRMIIAYSKSHVARMLGLSTDAVKLNKEAKILYERTGRSFNWLALGSIWFDVVGDWIERIELNGFCRISKLRFKDYMEKQRRTGFPYKENSSRFLDRS